MFLALFNLLQAQQPRGLSWLIWAAAIVVFLLGISLLVYFFIRLRKGDKELTEQDWSLSRRGIIVDAPASDIKDEAGSATELGAAEPEAVEMPEAVEIPEAPLPAHQGETRTLSSDLIEAGRPAEGRPTELLTEPVYAAETQVTEAQVAETQAAELQAEEQEEYSQAAERDERPTQLLVSEQGEEATGEPSSVDETTPFDEEIWNELEQPAQASDAAVVDHHSGREPFEPPSITRIRGREEYEPPAIEPIVPREGDARPTRSQAMQPPPATRRSNMRPESTGELNAAEMNAAPSAIPAAPAREHTVAASAADRPHEVSSHELSRRKVSGSILGLPATPSSEPFVFGERSRAADEGEIDALTNYGKDPYAGGGHGGTIALAVAVLLIAGAILAYLYIPSVHSRVDQFVARVRNRGQEPAATQAASVKPRAMIFISRNPQVTKNMVKVRGSVDNTDPAEPLEAPLFIEIALERRDGAPPDKRNVAVKPEPLAPGQRGIYEFEYDGKQYSAYSVSKLFSKGDEVKYSSPQQK